MKKSLIALAVLAASGAAMAQSSVTLFGIVDTNVAYVNKDAAGDSRYGLGTSGASTSRLGLRGTEDLGGGLKAGFWLEGEIFGDDGNASGFNFKRRSTDRKSTRLNSSHLVISYAVFCLKKKTTKCATSHQAVIFFRVMGPICISCTVTCARLAAASCLTDMCSTTAS